MYHTIFEYLFGWDFKTSKSTADGGIFGHLRAFFGCAELTERGCFHGHYLLFLRGGLNPSEIHQKMHEVEGYCSQFLAFFDSIIQYHLPKVDDILVEGYEPRIEMPPDVPSIGSDSVTFLNWQRLFEDEHKKIGERFQRHQCRPVCHKGYSSSSNCRFGYPHEVIESSRFDVKENSIIFARRESDVNGHNPDLLVYTRHNHDIKCILSGKAAKAAMFYISDYITKMPLSTDILLSTLSKAVSSITAEELDSDPIISSKKLLHRCLTHFGRKQQIHAQQCARYLRRLGDNMVSHE
ncbi:hypothetical protein F5051DRAFT_338265, partial [Lentinula edodes]